MADKKQTIKCIANISNRDICSLVYENHNDFEFDR